MLLYLICLPSFKTGSYKALINPDHVPKDFLLLGLKLVSGNISSKNFFIDLFFLAPSAITFLADSFSGLLD